MGKKIAKILNPIGSLVGDAFGKTAGFITSVLTGTMYEVTLKFIVEPILELMGITDQDIYQTHVSSVKIFDKDLFAETQQRLAIEYLKKNTGGKDYIMGFGNTGAAQFLEYYLGGKYDYIDYLPDARINAVGVPKDKIIKRIAQENANSLIEVIDLSYMVPSSDDWVKYYLQNNYNYKLNTESTHYNGNFYSVTDMVYNSTSNNFTATLTTTSDIRVELIETITTIITSIDSTTDNKRVKIERQTRYTRIIDNVVVQRDTVVISDTNTTIPKGSSNTSIVNNILSVSTIINPNITFTVTVPMYTSYLQYVVKYFVEDTGETKLWMYNPTTLVYPEIAVGNTEVFNFEMLPVVMFRNGFFNLQDYNKDRVEIDGEKFYRPPSITKKRYENTTKMLSSLGIDLDELTKNVDENPDIAKVLDGFVIIGVSPSSSHAVTSQALYKMFDFIYTELAPSSYTTTSAYTATFSEDPYNCSIMWIPKVPEIITEKIGSIGTYKHYYQDSVIQEKLWVANTNVFTTRETKVTNLILKHQFSDTQTRVLTLESLECINIIKAGSKTFGTKVEVKSNDFIIPLPVAIIENMSFIERTSLLSESLHMIFYSYNRKHLEYYETEKFAKFVKIVGMVVVIVVTIVVTIVTWGGGTAPTVAGLLSALGSLATSMAIGAALTIALKIIAKHVDDPTLKMALSAVAFAIAMYASQGLAGADANSFMTAMQLVNMSTYMVDLYVADINIKTDKLQNKASNFSKTYDLRIEQIDNSVKQLNGGINVDFMVDLSTDIDKNIGHISRTYSPSLLRDIMINGYKNYDMLYESPVKTFFRDKYALGVING